MKIKFIVIIVLIIPFLSYSKTIKCIKNDSLKLRMYVGAKVPYTFFSQQPYLQVGFSLIYKRNEFKTQYLFGVSSAGKPDMISGVSLEYFRQLKNPYSRLKFGAVCEYGKGKFYYSWGQNSNPNDRKYTTHGLFYGAAFSATIIRFHRFNFDFIYNTGILHIKQGVYVSAISLNLNYTY